MPINAPVTHNLVVNGVEYESVDDMPPEIRTSFERTAPKRDVPVGRMAAWMLLAGAIIGLLLLIYSSPR